MKCEGEPVEQGRQNNSNSSRQSLRKRKEGNKKKNQYAKKKWLQIFLKQEDLYKLNVERTYSWCSRIESKKKKITPKCYLQTENIKDEKETSSVSMKERQVIYSATTITVDVSSAMLSTIGQGNAILKC